MFEETLYTLLKKDILGERKKCIQIHCKQLDDLMGIEGVAGIDKGLITEVSGLPGSGKTQLCLQLCYSAILDQKKALFIDTCGGFDIDRYKEIVTERLKVIDTTKTLHDFLSNLFVMETYDTDEFIDIITNQLPDLVSKEPTISVIIIDSFPHLLLTIESKFKDEFRQTRIMHELLTKLMTLAYEANIAIVLTNIFVTKFGDDGKTFFVPALGSSYHHRIAQRLTLASNIEGDRYFANLEKSKYNPCRMVEFKITESGINDP